ncbi:heterokaryon incompatibility protein-domain-containing protein [Cladorrhinum sp. PSN259]|nr:heterokaryon incompatibility protein-domain-containing protein [Cladorrhinum sp. PSN259]
MNYAPRGDDGGGSTFLEKAIQKGNVSIVQLAVEVGCDVNLADDTAFAARPFLARTTAHDGPPFRATLVFGPPILHHHRKFPLSRQEPILFHHQNLVQPKILHAGAHSGFHPALLLLHAELETSPARDLNETFTTCRRCGALSYVWGDPTVTRCISVDGQDFKVTTNLGDALLELRDRRRQRKLWVDAICINQQDAREKSSQIPLMSQIYRDATRVIVWLGPSDPTTRAVISYVEAFVERRLTARSLSWIIPETEPICLCGSDQFRGSKIDGYLKGGMLQPDLDAAMGFSSAQWNDFYVEQIYPLSNKSESVNARNIWPMGNGYDRSLADTILATQGRASSDRRDAVYALYGLFTPQLLEQLPLADYSKPVEQVFLETTAYLINHDDWLPYEAFPIFTPRSPHDASFPSWLPDLSATGTQLPGTHLFFQSEYENFHYPAVSGDLKILSLSAWNLGPVRIIITLANTKLEAIDQLATLLVSTSAYIDVVQGEKLDVIILSGLARLCMRCYVQHHSYSLSDVTLALSSILITTRTSGYNEEQWVDDPVASLCLKGLEGLLGKTIFAAEPDILGIQEWGIDIQDGDILVHSLPRSISFIFRPALPSSADGAVRHVTMAGLAHIDGLMKGLETNKRLIRWMEQTMLDRFHIR